MNWGKSFGLWVSMTLAKGLERFNYYDSSVFGVFTSLSTGL
jgi:hypothetical protein